MPLALLLQNVTKALRGTATALTPWVEIVARESTVVERARSAFLVHWFGRRLPFDGLSLRARIVNVGDLHAQYLRAAGAVPVSRGGVNLTAPLAGFAGMVVGAALSPIGAIAGARQLLAFSGVSLGTILRALAWVLFPWLLGAGLVVAPRATAMAVGGGLVAAGAGFALAAALGDRREIRALFDLLGAMARMTDALAPLLEQVRGPREAVRHPLLHTVLDLADRLAAFGSQAIGVVAVLVTRIGPVLVPVAALMASLRDLATAVVAALDEIVSGLRKGLADLGGRSSIVAVITRVVAVARRQWELVPPALDAELDVLAATLRTVGDALSGAFDRVAPTVLDFAGKLFTTHPVGAVLVAFRREIAIIRSAFPAPAPGTRATRPSDFTLRLRQALPALPDVPTFPALPGLPDAQALRRSIGVVPPVTRASITAAADRLAGVAGPTPTIALGPEAAAAVARAGRRPSILTPERRAVEADRGSVSLLGPASDPSVDRFRDYLGIVLGRVLPPEWRPDAVAALAAASATAEHQFDGRPERTVDPERLPVLDLPTDDRLRTVVHTLRLRVPGAPIEEVRRFEARLTRRLRELPNPAVAGA